MVNIRESKKRKLGKQTRKLNVNGGKFINFVEIEEKIQNAILA